MPAWSYLEKLSKLPQRGSATEAEAVAARLLTSELQHLGYIIERQRFRAPRKTLYYGPALIMAIFIFAGLGIGVERPDLAFLLMTLALMPLLGELLGWPLNLDVILPKHRSQNIVATGRSTPDSAATAKCRVYVTAHYDTQFGSWLFAPFFRPYLQLFFTLSYAALAALLISMGIRMLLRGAPLTGEVIWISAIYLALALFWLLLNAIFGQHTNGANDNGSGVALALALAERNAAGAFPGLDLIFVFTGSEETGTRGMIHFINNLGLPKTDEQSHFVNLDNLGAGIPRYLEGEGMLGYTSYSHALIRLAERVSNEKGQRVVAKRNLLLPTDGIIAARAGYPAITFIAMDSLGRIPEYHWHTDKIANVDPELIAYMEDYLAAYLMALKSLDGVSQGTQAAEASH